MVDYIFAESGKINIAPTNAFVLLEWCVLVQQAVSKNYVSPDTILKANTLAAARSLEKCLRPQVKSGVQRAALGLSRRGLRSLFKAEGHGREVLPAMTSFLISGSDAVMENLPYVGVIAGVCARLPPIKSLFETKVRDVLLFYAKAVVGSKNVVAAHIAGSLHDLFASFVSVGDLVGTVIPPLEKAILRSPEIVLCGLVPSFVRSMPSNFDLTEPLSAIFESAVASVHFSTRHEND